MMCIKSLLMGIFFISIPAMAAKDAMWAGVKDTPECQQCLKDYAACSLRAINYAPAGDLEREITECKMTEMQCLTKNQCRNKQ